LKYIYNIYGLFSFLKYNKYFICFDCLFDYSHVDFLHKVYCRIISIHDYIYLKIVPRWSVVNKKILVCDWDINIAKRGLSIKFSLDDIDINDNERDNFIRKIKGVKLLNDYDEYQINRT